MFLKHQKQRHKEENIKIERRKLQYFAQNFEEKTLNLKKFQPQKFSFLISFERYKNLWLHQLNNYKRKLYSKGNGITTKKFNLKIQNCLNMPTIENEPHYMKQLICP
jgi:hypothetical protein